MQCEDPTKYHGAFPCSLSVVTLMNRARCCWSPLSYTLPPPKQSHHAICLMHQTSPLSLLSIDLHHHMITTPIATARDQFPATFTQRQGIPCTTTNITDTMAKWLWTKKDTAVFFCCSFTITIAPRTKCTMHITIIHFTCVSFEPQFMQTSVTQTYMLVINRGRAHQNQWNPKINQVHLCRHPDRGLLRLSWSQARRSFITTQLSVATQLQDRTPHYNCFLVIDKILCCIEHKEPIDRLQHFEYFVSPWKSRFESIILLKATIWII